MNINQIKIINIKQQNESDKKEEPAKDPRILVLQFNHYKFITRKYTLLFIALALLFTILGIIAIVKSMTIPCGVLLGSYCTSIRTFICTISFIFALSALGIGLSLRTEKEACKCLVYKAKQKLHRHFIKKKIENGLQGLLLWGEKSYTHAKIRQYYKITLQQMNEKKEETLHRLRQVTGDESVTGEEQEILLNETLIELQDFLDNTIDEFLDLTV